MTETYFRDVTDHGTLQRTARQHKVLIDRRQLDVAYWKDRVATKAGWKAQADNTDNTDTTRGAKLDSDVSSGGASPRCQGGAGIGEGYRK